MSIKFIKNMADLSIMAFTASGVWALYCGLAIGNTNAAIVPLFISGVFFIVFVPWQQRREEEEDAQCFCNDLKWLFKKIVSMEQNKKGSE